MRLAARFAQRWRCSSVSADHEEKNDDCDVRSRTREVWTAQRRCDLTGRSQPLRAEPAYKQRAPSRVLFDREVFEGASPIRSHLFAARPPLPHLQTNLRALVITVTHAMP
jgi:hypothetical protein